MLARKSRSARDSHGRQSVSGYMAEDHAAVELKLSSKVVIE